MSNRTKLLVHLRRISKLFQDAFSNGPDGTVEGKYASEHQTFIHHGCAFYLIGSLAYLEGEDGAFSWNSPGTSSSDFDNFVANYPISPKASYDSRGINKATMRALVEIRNAVVHNNSDLSKNRNTQSVAIVTAANLPGVVLSGSEITLEVPFLEFARVSTLAVRNYLGEL